jgi:hypothetical protein
MRRAWIGRDLRLQWTEGGGGGGSPRREEERLPILEDRRRKGLFVNIQIRGLNIKLPPVFYIKPPSLDRESECKIVVPYFT